MSDLSKWDSRFMELADIVSSWSKDPSTQVGCVIVDKHQRVVSVGFNGFPRGMEDNPEKLSDKAYKHSTVIHAESNAILFAKRDLTDCVLYSTFPICASCASVIMQANIAKVIYRPDKANVKWTELNKLANSHMQEAGIEIQEFNL